MDPIRVLILEDDDDIVQLITSLLDPGYECVAASNGLEGLHAAEAAEPDLVICDIMMPVMDGWEFMSSLRARPGFEHTPVIFLSALSSQDQIRKGYTLGAALYITKPLNPTRLKRMIDLFVSDHGIVPRPKHHRLGQTPQPGVDFSSSLENPPPRKTRLEPAHFPIEQDRPSRRPAAEPEQPRPARKPIITPPPPDCVAPRPAFPSAAAAEEPDPFADAPPIRLATPHPAETARPGGQYAYPSGQRVRVLVVDDDKDTCQMLTEGLSEIFDVLDAGDGISAIERAMKFKPDIFIVDGMLPRMTGHQLTMMLRKNREFYRSPIVFISGKASQRDQDYARSLGITQYVAKPFTPGQMLGILRRIAAQPEFTIHQDRPEIRPAAVDNFTRFENQRQQIGKKTLAEMEQQALENRLKQQLQ